MAHDRIHDLYTKCPNIRYCETKKGGFLGWGAEGYYYCSCTNQQIDNNYLNAVCTGKHNVYERWGNGVYFYRHFVDCNAFKARGIVN